MKKIFKAFAVNLVANFAATIGIFAAIVVWGNGLSDAVEEKAKKLFNR